MARVFKNLTSYADKGLLLFFSHCHLFLFLAAAATYLFLTDNHLGGADSAELLTASYNLGIAHPPGYPLFLVTAKLFSILSPFNDIVFNYNLFSTLCFLLSLFVIGKALSLFRVSPLAIFFGGLFYILSPWNERWVTTSDVFALHLLICSLGIYITARIIKQESVKDNTIWLGLIAGLGIANHHTIILLYPGFFMVYATYWYRLASSREKYKYALLLTASFLAGTLFYLQPLLSSLLNEHPVSAFNLKVDSFKDLSDLFLRKIYGTTSLTSEPDKNLPPLFWLTIYFRENFLFSKGISPFLGSAVLIFPLIAIKDRFKGLLLPASLWLVGSFSFFLLVDAKPTEIFLSDHIARMYLMPNMIATICAILSIDYLLRKMRRKLFLTQIFTFIMICFGIWWVVHNNNIMTRPFNQIDIERQVAKDILDACEPNSILLLKTDFTIFGVFYLQNTEKYRQDVLAITWPMTSIANYRVHTLEKIAAHLENDSNRNKFLASPRGGNPAFLRSEDLIASLLEAGAPIYTLGNLKDLFGPGHSAEFNLFRKGILYQIFLPDNKQAPEQIFQNNEQYIDHYSAWLTDISLNQQYPTEKELLRIFYLDYLKEMRAGQFTSDRLVFSTKTMEKLCHILALLDPEDPLSDFYIGLFYFRYKHSPASASKYFRLFLTESKDVQELKPMVDTARSLLDKIAAKNRSRHRQSNAVQPIQTR